MRRSPPVPHGDLSVTALYTAGTWAWASFPGASLYHTLATHRVFRGVNAVMALAGLLAGRRSTLRMDLVHRHAVLDALVRREDPRQVLELAAGLSPRGAAFTEGDGRTWVEVDLPAVVSYKHALLDQTPEGQAVLARPNLRRVAADVTTTPLQDILPAEGPVVVLAEGLLVYFDAATQQALWASVAAYLATHGGVLAFDFVPAVERPQAGWVGRALSGLMARFTGGAGFVEDPRTRHDIVAELQAAGFEDVEVVEPRVDGHAWELPHPDAPSSQLVFVARRRVPA